MQGMALPLFHFNVDSFQILNSYELLSKERNESTVFAVLDCIAFFLTVFALFAFSCVFIRRSQTSHWMEVWKTKIATVTSRGISVQSFSCQCLYPSYLQPCAGHRISRSKRNRTSAFYRCLKRFLGTQICCPSRLCTGTVANEMVQYSIIHHYVRSAFKCLVCNVKTWKIFISNFTCMAFYQELSTIMTCHYCM